jgi:hypothetical protein
MKGGGLVAIALYDSRISSCSLTLQVHFML